MPDLDFDTIGKVLVVYTWTCCDWHTWIVFFVTSEEYSIDIDIELKRYAITMPYKYMTQSVYLWNRKKGGEWSGWEGF